MNMNVKVLVFCFYFCVLALATTLLIVVGCKKSPDGMPQAQDTTLGSGVDAAKFTFEGHRYILFTCKNNSQVSGAVHDPACPVEHPLPLEKQ